ncbi:MAG: purine-nucleoside phosphorylase [Gemmatimonadetes bacterium]|nr:purine-nucleoside phosphorylase [Gemmatimonadota bacterium]
METTPRKGGDHDAMPRQDPMIAGAEHAHRSGDVRAAADAVRTRLGLSGNSAGSVAEVAIILGTGLGALARAITEDASVNYADIPGFPLSTVESHAGRLLAGTLAGKRVLAMQGRFHKYEGYSLQQVTFPVRVLHALGAETLIVSNACGCMRSDWAAGDLMAISDHINLIGDNPLVGPNDDALGPRFPDMTEAYDASLRALARDVAAERHIVLREGVYAAVAGPNLETRAEYAMLQRIGADVVGMSTVPEVIVARHAGMRVLGVSIITDMCIPETLQPASLEKILAVAADAEPRLTSLVTGVLERL